MNKLYYKLFMILFIAVAISGCKLDPPIYPEGTVANPGANGGGGIVSAGGTITYTMDGKTTTLKPAFFQVISSSSTSAEWHHTDSWWHRCSEYVFLGGQNHSCRHI
jgi:hypothetical protein